MSTTSDRVVGAVDDAAARLAAALRARLAEPGRDRDDDAARVAGDHLELVALADRRLVDVAADDQLGAGVDERSRARAFRRATGFFRVRHGAPISWW